MPEIRAFRALRYDPDVVGDLARVVAPPYDVVSPGQRALLAGRDPRNIVHLDLPADEPGDAEDERYRRAARIYARWRGDGTLRKDPRPALYVYEQAYAIPGTAAFRAQRGFFARVRLEPFGDGILPHERTMAGPKEDRHKLMRATAANLSAVVGMYADPSGVAARALAGVAAGAPAADVADDEGVRHRLWIVPGDASSSPTAAVLREAAGSGPIIIADGHHRYETALQYRDERRRTSANEEDPAHDYLLMLLEETTAEAPTILPTHRVVRGIGEVAGTLVGAARALFEVQAAGDGPDLAASFGPAPDATGGRGRIGLWTRAGGAVLVARRASFEPHLPAGGAALRRLDVSLLAVALERLCGIDPEATAAGRRLAYTKSAAEAIAWVDGAVDGADAAFLLEPTPVADVAAVAAEGDVMPQKSTYFYPKALTGLVINPLEW